MLAGVSLCKKGVIFSVLFFSAGFLMCYMIRDWWLWSITVLYASYSQPTSGQGLSII